MPTEARGAGQGAVVLTEARGRYQIPWSLSYQECERLGTASRSSVRAVHTLTAELCFQPLELNLKLVDSIAMFPIDSPVVNPLRIWCWGTTSPAL